MIKNKNTGTTGVTGTNKVNTKSMSRAEYRSAMRAVKLQEKQAKVYKKNVQTEIMEKNGSRRTVKLQYGNKTPIDPPEKRRLLKRK